MDHIIWLITSKKYTHLNREIIGIESIVEWINVGSWLTDFHGKWKSSPVKALFKWVHSVSNLEIWTEEYHDRIAFEKRWILISILTIFGDSQFFTFWWRGGWRGVLETEHVNYQKGKPEPFSLRKFGKEEGERGAANRLPIWWKEGIALLLVLVLAYF